MVREKVNTIHVKRKVTTAIYKNKSKVEKDSKKKEEEKVLDTNIPSKSGGVKNETMCAISRSKTGGEYDCDYEL